MNKLFIYILLPIIICSTIHANSHEYIIIKGSNVSFRTSPEVNSKETGKFKTNELVFLLNKSDKETKIGADKYYWYKVKRLDKKNYWVYGKYCYYIDSDKIPEKYYKQILDDLFSNILTTEGIGLELYNVELEFLKNENLITLKYYSIEPPLTSEAKKYYKLYDSKVKLFFETIYEAKVFFKGNYIFDINDKSICIRKINKKDTECNVVVRDNIRRDNYKKYFYDSYIEFDDKTLTLTKYFRDAPGVPMRIEKYHFNEQIDKFEKID